MTNLIVMLTCHDMTVSNAIDVFESCRNIPVKCWGFKDNGISFNEMQQLHDLLKANNKTIFFETLALTEEDCLASAKHAVALQVDYFMGGVFFPSVSKMLLENNIKYYPYIGDIVEAPRVEMNATPQEVEKQMNEIIEGGCEGVTLMAYENLKGESTKCMYDFFQRDDLRCIVAGSINDKYKIMTILSLGVFGFAIGSSFFKGDFDGPKIFKNQILNVLSFMQEQEGTNPLKNDN